MFLQVHPFMMQHVLESRSVGSQLLRGETPHYLTRDGSPHDQVSTPLNLRAGEPVPNVGASALQVNIRRVGAAPAKRPDATLYPLKLLESLVGVSSQEVLQDGRCRREYGGQPRSTSPASTDEKEGEKMKIFDSPETDSLSIKLLAGD